MRYDNKKNTPNELLLLITGDPKSLRDVSIDNAI